MITLIREVATAPGKTAGAWAFATEICDYVKDAYRIDIEVVRPIGGNPQRVAWCARYKDLAAWNDIATRLVADKKFHELNAETTDLFVAGTMRDSIWQPL